MCHLDAKIHEGLRYYPCNFPQSGLAGRSRNVYWDVVIGHYSSQTRLRANKAPAFPRVLSSQKMWTGFLFMLLRTALTMEGRFYSGFAEACEIKKDSSSIIALCMARSSSRLSKTA